MTDDATLPDPVIEETVIDSSLDDWSPDFAYPENLTLHVRLDSRRWLLLPDRYVISPLRGLPAAKAADALTASPSGKALVGLASRLRTLRAGHVGLLRRDPELSAVDVEDLEVQADETMIDLSASALEEFLGEARMEVFAWALGWCERCHARRVPLPSRRDGADRDPGGLVHQAQGPGAWHTYYQHRQVHLLRLGAACAWMSLGPFFFDLRPSP